MLQEQIEKVRLDLQSKMDWIISGGAGCLIVDESGDFVTRLFLASFEVFKTIPFFDRTTGEIMRYDYWVFFQEFYFNNGMQYSHLARMKRVEWSNENNVVMTRDDGWVFIISRFDDRKLDPRPYELRANWLKYYQDNGLEAVSAQVRVEYYQMMESQL
ncbi:MAG: hypothetical protein H8E87_01215 [FCB group bacterium]|nr:hypothetical protein [FCB group bacterium]